MARERESWQRDDKRDYGSDDLGYTNDDDTDTWRSQGRSGGEFRGGGRWRGGQQGQRSGEEYGEGRYGQQDRSHGGSQGRHGQQGRTYQSGRDPYRQGQGYEGGYQGERGYAGSRGGFASYGMGEGGGYGQRDDQRRGSQDRDFWDRASDEVSSWLGDDEAERRRRMDQQHRGKGPRGYTRSDERIKEDVNDRLTDDWAVDASDIDVDVESCEVTLTGEVPSREMKRRAEDVVEAVSGVKHVQNNLRVKQAEQATGDMSGGAGTTSL